MPNRKSLHLMLATAGAALFLLCLPDVAFARGGGGGRPGGGPSRVGPAGSGSVRRTRTRASGRIDKEWYESGSSETRSSEDSRREREAERERERAKREAEKETPAPPQRWPRKRGGQSYTVAEFEKISCDKVERVDGSSYFHSAGRWFEKVLEGGEVRWVEVEKPGG